MEFSALVDMVGKTYYSHSDDCNMTKTARSLFHMDQQKDPTDMSATFSTFLPCENLALRCPLLVVGMNLDMWEF